MQGEEVTFTDVQAFLKSWGMYPGEEDTDEYNEEVIRQGINNPCFEKMKLEAESLYGIGFARFCSRQTEATDDAFYLGAKTWAEVEDAWRNWKP